MRYLITTQEPMLVISAIEFVGSYNTLSFKKIDDYHAEVECDGTISGMVGYTCQINEV